jgi:hypothetical protein
MLGSQRFRTKRGRGRGRRMKVGRKTGQYKRRMIVGGTEHMASHVFSRVPVVLSRNKP